MGGRGRGAAAQGRGVRGRGSSQERLQAELKRRQTEQDVAKMAQLAAFLKESASEVSDTDMGEVCRQMLILTQTATQIPVVIADAVEPLVMALRSREEPSLLGNLLAALAALVSRSQRPSCDMAAKAHELGALEDVERLLEVADKLAAEDGRRGPLLSLRANCTVLLHAMVHTLPECLDQVLSSKALRKIGEIMAGDERYSGMLIAACDIFAHLLSNEGDKARPIAEEVGLLGSVSRIIARSEPSQDAELSVRALMVAGMLLPGQERTEEQRSANLKAMADVDGCLDGLVRMCRNKDSDCYAIGMTILQTMAKEESLVERVEESLQKAALEIAEERQAAEDGVASIKLN